jgi:hypothetical protein
MRISELQSFDLFHLFLCRYPVRCRVCLERNHVSFSRAWDLYSMSKWQPASRRWRERGEAGRRGTGVFAEDTRIAYRPDQQQAPTSRESLMFPDSIV